MKRIGLLLVVVVIVSCNPKNEIIYRDGCKEGVLHKTQKCEGDSCHL